jgi:hypothetical protein
MTLFLNVAIPEELSSLLGWVLMGVAGFNILVNLAITIIGSCKDIYKNKKIEKFTDNAVKAFDKKMKNR